MQTQTPSTSTITMHNSMHLYKPALLYLPDSILKLDRILTTQDLCRWRLIQSLQYNMIFWDHKLFMVCKTAKHLYTMQLVKEVLVAQSYPTL